ncbi:hypothetical protein [Microcoleus sp. EPA2]|uniref:hypothetical protein n=1 Tax=Microcoleus sp. EPA2 TaxID=2841654 RepID=UPI00312B7371
MSLSQEGKEIVNTAMFMRPWTQQRWADEISLFVPPQFTRLSSHTNRSGMVWGFPSVKLKTIALRASKT